tara:strand:- start:76587 stop:76925 length:339 start_codon:yes stop_codon:yes gene_type:complete
MTTEKIRGELRRLREKIKEKDSFLKEQKNITKQAAENLKNETKKHLITAIVAAFGFIIALVWRDTIKEYVSFLVAKFSVSGPLIIINFYTAIITTIIAVIGIIIMTKWVSKS